VGEKPRISGFLPLSPSPERCKARISLSSLCFSPISRLHPKLEPGFAFLEICVILLYMSKDKKNPIATEIASRAELVQEYSPTDTSEISVERVQLGVRMEKRMVKVLKALAEATDMTLTELFEDVMLHALEGHSTFSDPKLLEDITDFKRLYGMNYGIHDSYRFKRD
jgi:hypothetical protein